ncbi:MAG: hypothetical protein KME45_23125 [Stenomitos rutilans HA7619-LM2]|nr:hypothetical protein [Stenomitos rutilans HA7619-LM2]
MGHRYRSSCTWGWYGKAATSASLKAAKITNASTVKPADTEAENRV